LKSSAVTTFSDILYDLLWYNMGLTKTAVVSDHFSKHGHVSQFGTKSATGKSDACTVYLEVPIDLGA
jgi:hypothetical protein